MSDYRAVAAVTATLVNMLQPAVTAAVAGAVVKPVRPERSPAAVSSGEVTVYLFQVTPNPVFRNAELPVRRSDGSLVRPPQVALDLHYLISFYGEGLVPQLLLGAVISVLHAFPYPRVEDMPDGASGMEGTDLTGTGLQQQADRLRFSPLPLTHDELSKLWSIFFQVPYTLSVGYLCSVVLIEADLMPEPVLPIRKVGLSKGLGSPPQIESVSPQTFTAGMGSALAVRGRHLSGEGVAVRIGELEVEPRTASDQALEVPIPEGLPPGVQTVQVVKKGGLESNPAAVVVQPAILGVTFVASGKGGGESPVLSVQMISPPAPGQQVSLLLNERSSGGTPHSYRFRANPGVVQGEAVRFAVPGAAPGTYLMRVLVDGIASPLQVDTNPASLSFGLYTGPSVVIS